MKKIILILISIVFSFAITILKPYKFYRYDYYISKIAFNKKLLVVGLENGTILINDFKTNKNLDKIILPKIHDFMGDLIAMPIYSIDISPDGNNIFILAQGEDAKREMYIYNLKNKKLTHIYETKDTLMKARYIDNNHIFIALLSDEVELFNLKQKKFLYRTQVGNYVFSTYAINENKTKAVIGDESGSIKIVDIKTGKKLAKIEGFNKDKTISLDFVKNYIINGSSDKRVAIYDVINKNEVLTLTANFLPYASAISPDLKTFAIQFDEKNNIKVFDMNKKPLFLLKGHQMPLIDMKYINKNTIISYSPSEIIIWKIKGE